MDKRYTLKGKLVQGYRVASQPSKDYPEYGTIEKQKPFFKALGLDLDAMFNGTLNISISPYTFKMLKPEFTFENVDWTPLHAPETFSFSKCNVRFKGVEHPGWVYYPHPETKELHHQSPSTLEVLSREIPGINYGDEVSLELNPDEIAVQGSV